MRTRTGEVRLTVGSSGVRPLALEEAGAAGRRGLGCGRIGHVESISDLASARRGDRVNGGGIIRSFGIDLVGPGRRGGRRRTGRWPAPGLLPDGSWPASSRPYRGSRLAGPALTPSQELARKGGSHVGAEEDGPGPAARGERPGGPA